MTDGLRWLLPGHRASIHSVSTADGKATGIAEVPALGGRCAWNAEMLACPVRPDGPGSVELRIWRFTR
ncbi:hypothetical protein [Actinoplanes sp. GCM10030250]|uniref:hypothetical protein n=1 Tax=Actinoplanes sp. GCM10030250 TaxID=3273376 RepID=UPI003611BE1E